MSAKINNQTLSAKKSSRNTTIIPTDQASKQVSKQTTKRTMNDADIIPLNCIELTMVPSSGIRRVPPSGVWPTLDTVNWNLELASDRGELIAAGTFEPNSTAQIPTTTCWEDDITLPIIDCALLYVDDPNYKYYGKMQVLWNGTVWDPAIDTSSTGQQRDLNRDVVWLGDKCHDYIDRVCAGIGYHGNSHNKYLLDIDLTTSKRNIQEANSTRLWELDWIVKAYSASPDYKRLGNIVAPHNVRYRPDTTHRTLQCMEEYRFHYPSACVVFGLSKKSTWGVSSHTLKIDGRVVQTNDLDNWDCNIDMMCDNYIVTPLTLGCSDDLSGLSGAAIAFITAGIVVASGLVFGLLWCYCRSRPRFHREDQLSIEANKKRKSDTESCT
jgi:hypothetical protein